MFPICRRHQRVKVFSSKLLKIRGGGFQWSIDMFEGNNPEYIKRIYKLKVIKTISHDFITGIALIDGSRSIVTMNFKM